MSKKVQNTSVRIANSARRCPQRTLMWSILFSVLPPTPFLDNFDDVRIVLVRTFHTTSESGNNIRNIT